MLEETVEVVSVAEGEVWVETQRRSSCDSCAVNGACGTSVIGKLLGQRRSRMRVISEMPLAVGDRVVVGIRERALVRGSLAIYALPIVLLLCGALLGRLGAERLLWASAEAASIVLGIAGLAAGLLWVRHFTHRALRDPDYHPVVLRRSAAPMDVQAVDYR